MATKDEFVFGVNFEKVPPSMTLWRMRADRPKEFSALVAALQDSPEETKAVGTRVQGEIEGVRASSSASDILDACAREGVSLEWMSRVACDCLDERSATGHLLFSLMDRFRPLRITKDLPKELKLELGSSNKVKFDETGF